MVAGISAPINQKSGRKMPAMNMTQWPFLIYVMPRENSSTT
jgi:hypothetical protein